MNVPSVLEVLAVSKILIVYNAYSSMSMKNILPFVGEKSARDRIDEVFSRQMLGSVAVGSSFMKVVEWSVTSLTKYLYTSSAPWGSVVSNLMLWSLAFILSVFIFVYWDDIERRYEEAKEKAEEKVNGK